MRAFSKKTKMAALPVSVEVASWITFAAAFVVTLIFSTWYILGYRYKRHSECSSTFTAILALSVSFLTVLIGPIDVFLVSFMKNDDGEFKDWAESNVTRHHIQETVLYCYYALYGCLTLFVFLIIPFVYFYYEEQDENTNIKSRMCGALKYTACFIFVAVVLLVIGAFVPLKKPPTTNSTSFENDLAFLANELRDTRGETALYFTVGFLTLIGFICLVFYTGFGMVTFPADLIKGRKSTAVELDDVRSATERSRQRRRAIRRKYKDKDDRLSTRDRSRIDSLQDQEELLKRKERHLEDLQHRCCSKCSFLWRPFEIIFGVVGCLMALLIFTSLLLTSLDRALHSLGLKTGYILPERHLPNPIDMLLLFSQQVFPLDYIIFAAIILYLFLASIAGIERIGIWFCCVKMYKIRATHTKPQALLFLCMILIFTVLAINTMMYTLAPEYMSYGNQKYIAINNSTEQCTTYEPEDCVMTIAASLLTTSVFMLWYFGAVYYWANWAFLAMVLIGLLVALFKKRRSAIEGEVDSDDTDDSDDELLHV
ncbi:probable lysosomal cobalamin transporter [Anneissia japonica]|uniref:probable lysosomal cobalamin transporter n=1 Tax=Anneissia japonica TaxID=1529436 RepID=UPI0014256E36|nr:probable lysosomal cobalamin transporter [Anneissia japonica]